MSNNYCQSSSWLDLPKNKFKQARKICERIEKSFTISEEGYCGVEWKLEKEPSGIWLYGDESLNPDHLERLVRALVEKLKLKPALCSWAYTCDKLHIDEFGGGAFVIIRGQPTIWCDARSTVQAKLTKLVRSDLVKNCLKNRLKLLGTGSTPVLDQ